MKEIFIYLFLQLIPSSHQGSLMIFSELIVMEIHKLLIMNHIVQA
jgi:hypothetical protein